MHLSDSGGVVIAEFTQNCVARDAERREAVQDGLTKTGDGCHSRVRVQRIAVAAQAVDQRLFRARRQGAMDVGRSVGNGVHGLRRT